jgi:hypothetical protein
MGEMTVVIGARARAAVRAREPSPYGIAGLEAAAAQRGPLVRWFGAGRPPGARPTLVSAASAAVRAAPLANGETEAEPAQRASGLKVRLRRQLEPAPPPPSAGRWCVISGWGASGVTAPLRSLHGVSQPARGTPMPEKPLILLERVKGIEPSSSAWKAVALPLSYTRAGRQQSDVGHQVASISDDRPRSRMVGEVVITMLRHCN